MTAWRGAAAALLVLSACIEGPTGPAGPPGPSGPAGADARLSIDLIEFSASEAAWEVNGWSDSYVFFDPRITPSGLIEVYIKKFYQNTGGAYYEQFALWTAFAEAAGGGSTFYQLFDGGIRFYDPGRRLQNRTIVLAVST